MQASDLCRRMREDWNRRAREDAKYYVAFGRRGQDDEEFFATGAELARGLARELERLPPGNPRARRALEIGCGLGRLMLPLAARFGEIHGVDVSDEMVRLAREKLRDVPHAHVHWTAGADLAAFADDSFDFVYSYAVFQHIPAREVVFQYLREARRVLKPGGVFRFQVNGLPPAGGDYDTWSGVRLSAQEIADFAREHDFQLLALEGVRTQYQWVTLVKRPPGWWAGLARRPAPPPARIRRITNAHSSEPAVPSRGRFAAASLWLEELPEDCDLNALKVTLAGAQGRLSYLGPERHGLRQLNVELPQGLPSGLQPVELFWWERPIAPRAVLRVIPPPPAVPRVVSVSDAVDLLAGTRIRSRTVQVCLEEAERPEQFEASIDGRAVGELEIFCADSLPPLHVITLRLPEGVGPGVHRLEMRLGRRAFAPVQIEVLE